MLSIDRREFLRRSCAAAVALAGSASRGPGGSLAQTTPVSHRAKAAGGSQFCFLHTYEATGRYWAALERAGLVRSNTGVRLVHSPWGDDSRRFNHVARRDGDLYRIVRSRRCPLVIDRVVGGSPYHPYNFDPQLIRAYSDLLGPSFLGGQIHETVCNVQNDWGRFLAVAPRYAREPIHPDALRGYFDWSRSKRYLEYGTLDDYAGRRYPQNIESLWKETIGSFEAQAGRFWRKCCYCEGSTKGELVWHAFYQLGARWCLAEVGPWASRETQFTIASLRGAAKAAGKPWGVFFAPWGPHGCTSFVPLKETSWQIPAEELALQPAYAVGPDNGPSSALQRRSFFHAYLSGAHALYEEWGAECNLTSWDRAELSSYGRVTRDLLDFQASVADVGEPFVPIALVLDATAIPPVDIATAARGNVHRWFAPRAIDLAWAKVKEAIYTRRATAASKACPAQAQPEVACYAPSPFPELFDIVPSDAPEEVWSGYRQVIAVSDGHAPSCAERGPVDAQVTRLTKAIEKWSPLARSGDMPMQINFRASDKAWIIGLYNPYGAYRGDVGNTGALLDERCAQRETIRMKSPVTSARVLHAWPAGSDVQRQGDELQATVGPGGVLIVEICCTPRCGSP